MLFWMRSKTYMSKINLQSGILTVENRRSREKKRICSEVSVISPGNPWSQSRRRNGRLWWEGFAEKESFKPGVEEWRGDGWWEWWVDVTNGGSATHTTGWVRIGEISAWLTEGSRELIPETRGSILEGSVTRREDDVDGRASVAKDEERVLRGGWTVMRLWLWPLTKQPRSQVAVTYMHIDFAKYWQMFAVQ